MQLSYTFSGLALFILALANAGISTPVTTPGTNETATGAADKDTAVVYCTTRDGNVCSSPCTVYNGGTTCLAAPDTNCLSATNDIGFCDKPGCTGDCTFLTGCILQLEDGFCWTPNTQSILVSTA